ncbi:MAG TPA: carbohydrate kinase [Mycobacteriales bacterium]|nr:carbohydrate kinase [Mycobacteriales bacterium]
MTIGVIGESLVDVFTDADGESIERAGGSPFNIAIGLARLDIPARLFTSIGDDARGERLLATLSSEGVAVTHGTSTSPTSVASASLDGAGRATYSFELAWDPRFDDEWPPLDALHFGSLGSVVGPGAAEVAAIVERYRGEALISYDPNWRDGVVDVDPRSAVEANAALADIVKLSDEDAAAVYPGVALEDVAHALLDLGPVLVVITKGAEGASAWTRNTAKHCDAPPVDVVDTVGAGDAFMATVLSELGAMKRDKVETLTKRELELVLEFASFVAGRTCERVGADPPHLADLF